MSVISTEQACADPLSEYIQCRNQFQAKAELLERQRSVLGNSRFILVIVSGILLAVSSFERSVPSWLAAIPFGLFIVTAPWAQSLTLLRHRTLLKIRFYQFGIDRMGDQWMGKGTPGTEFINEDHLYTQDLDIFGRGSLFERLCIAQTETGRRTLARWLAAPAAIDEIRLRHEAISELCEPQHRYDFMEIQYLAAKPIATDALVRWAKQGNVGHSGFARLLAPILLLITVLAFVGWVAHRFAMGWAILAFVVQAALAVWMSGRVNRALSGLDQRADEVVRLGSMLFMLESKSFRSKKLAQLQASLCDPTMRPSRQLVRLIRYLSWLEITRNPFMGLASSFLLWRTQIGLAVESWRGQTGPALIRWLEVLSEIEALNSLSAYHYENPGDPFPNFKTEQTRIEAHGLSHPLLPRAQAVGNDLSLSRQESLLIVSGSNMSGKSTFLRTIGVNIVLALAGAPVRAKSMTLCPVQVGTSLRNHDSLQAGKSRFYAEITRLRKIIDRTNDPLPVLFLLDEILSGTNSHDRRIGAEAIVRLLLSKNALGLMTTHDLALTALADHLAPHARNVHFRDDLVNGELSFDYQLRSGVVQKSNALALMRSVGLIVDEIKNSVNHDNRANNSTADGMDQHG